MNDTPKPKAKKRPLRSMQIPKERSKAKATEKAIAALKASAPEKKSTGRKTKLTPLMLESLVTACRLGLADHKAAGFAGVSPMSLIKWKTKGEDHRNNRKRSIYRQLLEKLEKATADRQAEALVRVRKHAEGLFTETKKRTVNHPDGTKTVSIEETTKAPRLEADTWFLERSAPNEWGPKNRTEVTGANGGPVNMLAWTDIVAGVSDYKERKLLEAEAIEAEVDDDD